MDKEPIKIRLHISLPANASDMEKDHVNGRKRYTIESIRHGKPLASMQ